MNQVEWTLLAIGVGISFSGVVIWRLQSYRKTVDYQTKQGLIHRFLKFEERVITGIHQRLSNWFCTDHQQRITPYHMLEILLIGLWAFWVGREYLNFDPRITPSGREFNSAIQTHHLWTRFRECGWCALWNGTARGGNPAFVDSYGSMLHPLVFIPTLIWGMIKGAKITLVLSFWTAGIAQWWIARELKFSRIPRLWSSGLAVVGGHLAGRMELGLFVIILSTAMASLVLGGVLALVNRPGTRSAVLLGLVGGSALLAGQGYIQLGLAGTLPAYLFLLLDQEMRWKPIRKYFLLALGIAVLIGAVFLVPFVHFSANFSKYLDPEFKLAQPLKFIPLNYLIDTFDYYHSDALEKYPFPSLYTLFIGWIPIILAVYGLTDRQKISRSVKWFLITSLVIILLFASGTALRPLAQIWAAVAGFRHPSLIAGLTIPIILGFSGAGLEKLLHLDWPKVKLSFSRESPLEAWSFHTHWFLVLPLFSACSRVINLRRSGSIPWKSTPRSIRW